MTPKQFPFERLFAASDELIQSTRLLSHNDNREAVAMLLLSAASVACMNDFTKREFLRGVESAWRTAEGSGSKAAPGAKHA